MFLQEFVGYDDFLDLPEVYTHQLMPVTKENTVTENLRIGLR